MPRRFDGVTEEPAPQHPQFEPPRCGLLSEAGMRGPDVQPPIHPLFGLPPSQNIATTHASSGTWKSPAERNAMNRPTAFIVATLALALPNVMSGVEAQQQQPQQAAPQLPQAPNMTFFVTSV